MKTLKEVILRLNELFPNELNFDEMYIDYSESDIEFIVRKIMSNFDDLRIILYCKYDDDKFDIYDENYVNNLKCNVKYISIYYKSMTFEIKDKMKIEELFDIQNSYSMYFRDYYKAKEFIKKYPAFPKKVYYSNGFINFYKANDNVELEISDITKYSIRFEPVIYKD